MSNTVETTILFLLLLMTVLVVFIAMKSVKRMELRVWVVLSAISIFIYSGYGIAYPSVDNSYLIKYLISLIFFYLPISLVFNNTSSSYKGSSSLDLFLDNHESLLRFITILYLIITTLPMVYPRFRLFDVFSKGISLIDRYDFINASGADSFKRLCITLATFLRPFFYAYLVYLRYKRPKSFKPIVLFALEIALGIMDACYIGRGGMIYNFILLFFLWFSLREGHFQITKKQILVLLVVTVCSLPFMYIYTFIRLGASYDNLSFIDSINSLIESEAACPTYYDHIISSPFLDSQTPISFLLWLLFLPIPSLIWPTKPSLANDVFTYSITGLHKTDSGYYSLVTSYLGEGLMFFGEKFYWAYALITGLVFALILKYLLKSRYMHFFILFLVVNVFSIGRAGASAVIPIYVNGTISVLLLDLFVSHQKS